LSGAVVVEHELSGVACNLPMQRRSHRLEKCLHPEHAFGQRHHVELLFEILLPPLDQTVASFQLETPEDLGKDHLEARFTNVLSTLEILANKLCSSLLWTGRRFFG